MLNHSRWSGDFWRSVDPAPPQRPEQAHPLWCEAHCWSGGDRQKCNGSEIPAKQDARQGSDLERSRCHFRALEAFDDRSEELERYRQLLTLPVRNGRVSHPIVPTAASGGLSQIHSRSVPVEPQNTPWRAFRLSHFRTEVYEYLTGVGLISTSSAPWSAVRERTKSRSHELSAGPESARPAII